MKKLTTILFLFVALESTGQFPVSTNPYLGYTRTLTFNRGWFVTDSGFAYTNIFRDTITAPFAIGELRIRPQDTLMYFARSLTGRKWYKLGSTGGGVGSGVGPATFIVAASNSPATLKARADYICDGVGDQVEINAALILGNVTLEQGTYNIDTTTAIFVPAHRTLAGTGDSTIITSNAVVRGSQTLIANSGDRDIVLRDFRINGNAQKINMGILFERVGSGLGANAIKGVLIDNVIVDSVYQSGIQLNSCYNSIVNKVRSKNCHFDAVVLHPKVGDSLGCVNVTVSNCILANGTADIWTQYSKNFTFINNICEGDFSNGFGQLLIQIERSTDGIVANNIVRRSGEGNIFISDSSRNIVVSGNNCDSTNSFSVGNIYVEATSYGITIVGNEVWNSWGDGIMLTGTKCIVDGNYLHDNSYGDGTAYGIEVTAADNKISNNRIYRGTTNAFLEAYGIRLSAGAARAMVTGNFLYQSGVTGDILNQSTTARIRNNVNISGTWYGDDYVYSNDISPAQITVSQNNYNPTGLAGAAILRLNSSTTVNVTGLSGGTRGRMMIIFNIGANPITFTNEDASSTAGNRFTFSTGANAILNTAQGIYIYYDSTSQRWRDAANSAIALTSSTTGPINVTNYGVVADGVTNNYNALLAIQAWAGSRALYFPKASNIYLVNAPSTNGLAMNIGQRMFGDGDSSMLKTTINGVLLWMNDLSEIDHLHFIGSGQGTPALPLQSLVMSYQKSGGTIHDCLFEGNAGDGSNPFYGGAATVSDVISSTHPFIGVKIDRSLFRKNTTGVYFSERGEYSTLSNVGLDSNTVAILLSAGNYNLGNVQSNGNATNLSIVNDINSGHGTITNCQFNHATTNNLNVNGITNGQTFENCKFYDGNAAITNCTGIQFIGCDIAGGPKTWTLTNNTKLQIMGGRLPQSPTTGFITFTVVSGEAFVLVSTLNY